MVQVSFDGKTVDFEKNTPVGEVFRKLSYKGKYPLLGALLNNEVVDLEEQIKRDSALCPIDISSSAGLRIYSTSLSFVLVKAVKKIFPHNNPIVQHSLAGGLFIEFEKKKLLSFKDIQRIKDEMKKIIEGDLPITKETIDIEDGIDYFTSVNDTNKIKFLKNSFSDKITIYTLDGEKSYFYGPLASSTGVLGLFDLLYYPGGMVLMFPTPKSPDKVPKFEEQQKLFRVYHEFQDWQKILNVQDVGSLNEAALNGTYSQLIKISEIIHEKKLSRIADKINSSPDIKLILIAGPSSSGKTTFTKRLSLHLQVAGTKTAMISLDNYFVDRDATPLDEKGAHDFEHIDAIDIELFNEHLMHLIEGQEVEIPEYNFKTGSREYAGNKLKLDRRQVILIEGIHGLNPKLTHYIPEIMKFKIYISALTQLNVDSYNRIPTTDSRLIRRMVRDSKYRNYSAEDTLKRWPSVRQGEERWIFPFQENATDMFNSALIYELAVLKSEAENLLRKIEPSSCVYAEAKRLQNFLNYFISIGPEEIPPTSILREFLGNSSFKY